MLNILKNPSKSEIQKAIEYNWYDFIRRWSNLDIEGIEYEDKPEYFKLMTGVPYFRLNVVLDTHISPDNAEETVRNIVSTFKERRMPFIWILGPSSSSDKVKEHILKNKLIFIIKPPGMAFNLNNLSEDKKKIPDLEIVKVEDTEIRNTFLDVGLTGLEWDKEITYNFLQEVATQFYLTNNPKYSGFLAYYKGEPVAISRVFYGAGVAGIYRVTTLEGARHKGIGTAISLAPLYEAKELGYEIATLISTDMGFNIYKRIGFNTFCDFEIFGWSPDSSEIFSVLIH